MIALLENARQLAVRQQQRQLAADVVRSCAMFAKSLRHDELGGKLSALSSEIADKNNAVLNDLLDRACYEVIRLVG
jgi:hypothetical protein